jgi:hypothetical protein
LDIYKCPKTGFPFGFPEKKRNISLVTEKVSFRFLVFHVVIVKNFKETLKKFGHFLKWIHLDTLNLSKNVTNFKLNF